MGIDIKIILRYNRDVDLGGPTVSMPPFLIKQIF